MSVEIHKLSNGATIIIDSIPTSPTVSIGWFFNRGARHETKKENGIAHNLEHLAFKGTATRTARQLAQEIDFLGLNANAFTSQDMTAYVQSAAADQVIDMNRILYDMVANMNYPDEHINIERGVICGEIGESMDDPGDVLDNAYMGTAFPSHAFGRPILGPKEHIRRFTRDDFDAFRAKHIHGSNLVVSLAGNIDADAILPEMEETAGQLAGGKSIRLIKPKYVGGYKYVTKPDNENTQIQLGFNAAANGHHSLIACSVMNAILGGSFSSRLFEEVREKRGMGYVVGSGAHRTYDAGTHMLMAGVQTGEVEGLMQVFCDEVNRIKQESVTDLELQSAKNGFKNRILKAASSEDGRMAANAFKYFNLGRVSTSPEFLEKLYTLTQDDILKAAQNSLSGTPTLSAVGPGEFPDYDDVLKRLDI